MLKIDRKSDSRVIKAIVHRLADIPGGVTVSVADLGGDCILEATPLYIGANGKYNVVKTGQVVTAYSSGTSLQIAKGHHFKVGDKIAPEDLSVHATILAIDKTTNTDKDVLTLAAAFDGTIAQYAKIITVTVTEHDDVNHGAVVQGAIVSAEATSFNVDKGHTLAVGDYVAGTGTDPMTGKQVTNIDRGNDGYDTITIGAANVKALADDEELVVVTASGGTTAKDFAVSDTIVPKSGAAVAIAGSNYDVVANDNLFVDAWLIAVVKEANGPVITNAIKSQLSSIKYV